MLRKRNTAVNFWYIVRTSFMILNQFLTTAPDETHFHLERNSRISRLRFHGQRTVIKCFFWYGISIVILSFVVNKPVFISYKIFGVFMKNFSTFLFTLYLQYFNRYSKTAKCRTLKPQSEYDNSNVIQHYVLSHLASEFPFRT